ncbi:PLP-dependent aminotransferase family protein [Caulobacter sp. 1776]|uniref:MocR-like pyridoxine biosynthesis transcription factor PdxR n=1 Tax=Caulobacter sp. 1776 TaxID=3156420 RepID=UPI0033952F2D
MDQASYLDALAIDRGSEQSLHGQLYDRIHVAIREGRLPPGARLPSTRSLSIQLGVARGTIDAVYARLAGEGCLIAQRHSGTIVAPGFRAAADTSVAPPRANAAEPWLPLQLGLPALDLFPRKPWTRILARQARQLPIDEMIAPAAMGLPALREAIAAYLAVSRGVTCGVDQIVVTHGFQDALNLTVDLVLAMGDTVWIEDPGYGFVQQTLSARGMAIAPVPVDEEGLCVDQGRAEAPAAKLAIVTPAHQFPLGITLSPARRHALLTWAAEAGGWILEDDYDCEFHYSGHKPAALKAMDVDRRVFYAGSFSKSLLPSLRLGYLVVPPQLAEAARTAQQLRHRGVAMFEQLAVAEFMRQGHFARHLRRMMVRYKARRNALVAALERQFGDRIVLTHRAGGLHVLGRFPGLGDDADLARRALKHGLKPSPLSGQYLKPGPDQGLLMSFTNVPEEKADEVAATLSRAIG